MMVSPGVVVEEAVSLLGPFVDFGVQEQEHVLWGPPQWMLSKYSSKVPGT